MERPDKDESNFENNWDENEEYDEEKFFPSSTDQDFFLDLEEIERENDERMNVRENEIEIEVEVDPIELIIFSSLNMIGIQSIFMTTFFTGILEGTIATLPLTGAYAATMHFINRKQHQAIQSVPSAIPSAVKPSFLREIGRDMTKKSFTAGIFFGTFMAIDETLEDLTDMSELTRNLFSGMTSASLAAISYRKPHLVLPSIGVALVSAFFGFLK